MGNVYVFDTLNNNGLNVNEVIVDNPLAIIHKNVKTKLTAKKAEVLSIMKLETIN